MQRPKKYFAKFKEPLIPTPNLVAPQIDSYKWFIAKGISEIFKEFSPIKDYSGKKFELEFADFKLSEPKYDEYYAKNKELSYEAPLRATVRLNNKIIGASKEQEIFMTDLPLMTEHGTFIINGIERVIVPQLIRSFGVLFTMQMIKGKKYFGSKIIPGRGAWIEIEIDPNGAVYVRIDRKRKFPVTSFFRILGAEKDEDIKKLFKGNEQSLLFIENTLAKDIAKNADEAYIEIHKKLRDGDLATAGNAREFLNAILSDERYDLSKVGRFRFNNRFNKSLDNKEIERRTINLDDIATVFAHMVKLQNTPGANGDDIDHLASRRVRFVGEMIQQKLRVAMSQMKRNIQDKMSTIDTEATLPIQFISPRPLQARIKEFFTTNQLSQFMSQENTLAEIEHLRRLSALGPGGLTRERAGFEVRDVHPSHYGRL
ncbi:MAG: DNA-directed RNA polymerase subunit beta, partial [Patescibacteria group bacterium]